jgi:hypothetical protein
VNPVAQERFLHPLGRCEIDFQIPIELCGGGGKNAGPIA